MLTSAINLLPPEIILGRKQSSKIILVNRLSIGVMAILVFITSATLALRFSQNLSLNKAQQNLAFAEGRVTELQEKEGQLILLKARLAEIQSLLGEDQSKKEAFNLLLSLVPSGTGISDLSLDNKGVVAMSIESSSLQVIDSLLSNLSTPEKTLGLISRVDLENLSLGKNGFYTISLRVGIK